MIIFCHLLPPWGFVLINITFIHNNPLLEAGMTVMQLADSACFFIINLIICVFVVVDDAIVFHSCTIPEFFDMDSSFKAAIF